MKFRKTIGDSWKALQGFQMQHKEDFPGYCVLTFTKQVENVILGIQVKANDDGTVDITNEYIYEIINEEEYYETKQPANSIT
jgi:hypothetical protein